MYPQKAISRKTFLKKFSLSFVGVLKVNDENSRIWIRIQIHQLEAWIRGSGSTPKCHRFGTLQTTIRHVLMQVKVDALKLMEVVLTTWHSLTHSIMHVLMQVKVEALKLMEVVLTTWHSLTNSADLFSVEDLARRLHLELSRASIYKGCGQ
jgi:hypothetical protein